MKKLPNWLVIILMLTGLLIGIGILMNMFGRSSSTTTSLMQRSLNDSALTGIVMEMPGEIMMEESAGMMVKTESFAPSPLPPTTDGGSAAVDLDGNEVEARIIKNGSLRLRVEDADEAMSGVQSIVTANNGFVQSSTLSDPGEGPRTAYMTLRIPVDSFETVIASLKDLSVLVLEESTSGQDVTTEFIDLEANLRNARAEEASYVAILERSGSIEEVLAVTRQIADVRGRIERYEARMRYLENKTDLATLQLTLTEETRIEVPSRKWQPLEILRQAVRDLVQGLQAFVNVLIYLVIAVIGLVIPVALIVALLLWIGWMIVKRITKKRTKR